MNQHESRKVAMQAIYLANQEPDLNAEEVEAKVVTALNLKQLSAYSKKLIEGVLENRADLQSALSEHLKKRLASRACKSNCRCYYGSCSF